MLHYRAGLISKRFGYKKTIVFGLMLYVIGAICFYPAAQSLQYGAFVGCLFVIACGLATLENCKLEAAMHGRALSLSQVFFWGGICL
jgi:fucose permease